MRIIRIEVENLNSLYGPHSLDLDQDLGEAPLFLIRGKTGAGKSTLMDAISLALFGETPRLGRNSSEGEEDTRQVMSRGTGWARARVTFSKVEGSRARQYRATWQCHRSRKQPDGKFQKPRRVMERYVAATDTWEELVSDQRDKFFAPVFEEVLEGLSVEDFKRMVLLAQGEFAAFINASEDRRAAILERLTSTRQYKDIGRRANRRRQQAEQALNDAAAKKDAVQLMPEEQEQELRQALKELEQDLKTTQEQAQQAEGWLRWRERRDQILEQLATARQDEVEARQQQQEHQEELDRLAEHERCAGARALLTEVDRLLGVVDGLEEEIPGLEQQEKELALVSGELRQDQRLREQDRAEARAAWDAQKKEIQQAREVRSLLAAETRELSAAQKEVSSAEQRLERAQQVYHEVWEQVVEVGPALKGTVPEEQLAALKKEIAGCAIDIAEQEAAENTAQEALKVVQTRLDDLRWAAGLAGGRNRLQRDEPCPLCGGTEHPYIRDNTHQAADQEIADRLSGVEQERLEQQQSRDDAAARLVELRQRLETLRSAAVQLEKAEMQVQTFSAAHKEIVDKIKGREGQVEKLTKRAAEVLEGKDPGEVERSLEQRLEQAEKLWNELAERVLEAEKKLTRAQTEHRTAKKQLREDRQALERGKKALTSELQALELADSKDLQQRLIDPDQAERLKALRETLQQKITSATAILLERKKDREQHQAQRPEDLQPGAFAGEALSEHVAQLKSRAKDLGQELTEKQTILKRQDEDRARHVELERVWQEARKELRLWQRLHRLIGVKDGDAFKRFAQTMNMQELVGRANGHLKKLEPRYTLVPALGPEGEPLLAFSVQDTFQASASRALKTLSGGETFLVSLALALALADYRTVRMPVETLLLDEGFGTLDGDTLQVAMNALRNLNARGTQVGVISHVEALKEAIPACVVVEKMGNGRSTLRVEARGK